MAWTCRKCSTAVRADDLVCPQCNAPKTAWSMAIDVTRAFVLSGNKVEYKRGQGYEAVPRDDASHDPARVVDADRLYVLDKETVRAIHERGLLPPSVHVVHVRIYPKKLKDLKVGLAVVFAEAEEREQELPYEGEANLTPEGWLDVNLLFVYGPGELEGVTFPGIHHIVDVSEETAQGFAPKCEVWALKKKRQELPCQLLPPWFEAQVRTSAGEPLRGWRWKLELGGEKREGVLDDLGRLHLDDVEIGVGKLVVLPPEEPGEAAEPGEAQEEVWVAPDQEPFSFEDELEPSEPGTFRFSV